MQSGKYGVDLVVDGNVISERTDGVVAVPFGKDYAIRLRNDDSRRAVAVIYIDGINVSDDGFVVGERSQWTIERPADKAVTFRLASSQSTAAAEHGKAGEDTHGEKGLIRVEWRAELYRREPQGIVMRDGASDINLRDYSKSVSRGFDFNPHASCSMGMNSTLESYSPKSKGGLELCSRRIVVNDAPKAAETLSTAVTVEGQASSQKFVGVQVGPLETSATVIQLKLKGYEASQGVPITGTNYCPNCRARTAKPTDKFCRNCGVSLSTRSSLGKPH
jgi:hypothetical protein